MSFWTNKEILITGGTGSLGKTLTKKILDKYSDIKGIRIFSRDELKQWQMKQEIKNDNKIPVSYLVGDIRDRKRIELACKNVNIIIHCAALKQVPSCEDNPLEAIQTNIIGSQNILYAALENKVDKVMAVSSDKAVYPINLYGATKLCSEKLFVQGNTYSGGRSPRFSCVRYGNVLGSRGSVVPLFKKQYEETKIVTVTDKKMTRFWITLDQVTDFILGRIEEMKGGEIFVPKMGSTNIMTLVEAIVPAICEVQSIGIRAGEKLHETLITKEESRKVKELKDYFIIIDEEISPSMEFEYSSDKNKNFLTYQQIRRMLKDG